MALYVGRAGEAGSMISFFRVSGSASRDGVADGRTNQKWAENAESRSRQCLGTGGEQEEEVPCMAETRVPHLWWT
jgi:hypothetical protein